MKTPAQTLQELLQVKCPKTDNPHGSVQTRRTDYITAFAAGFWACYTAIAQPAIPTCVLRGGKCSCPTACQMNMQGAAPAVITGTVP